MRLLTVPGDSRIAGSGDAERTDLALSTAATDCIEGREHWWAHSILFPDDYVDPPMSSASTWNWATVFDFHLRSQRFDGANAASQHARLWQKRNAVRPFVSRWITEG